jgi:hypothetical protein
MATKKTTTADTTAKQEQETITLQAKKKATGARAKLQKASENMQKQPVSDLGQQVIENMERSKKQPPVKLQTPFKKPNSDYYRLDLIVRGVAMGKMTSDIRVNYKDYVETMAAAKGISITKYIQSLIDKDMNTKANKQQYEELKKNRK